MDVRLKAPRCDFESLDWWKQELINMMLLDPKLEAFEGLKQAVLSQYGSEVVIDGDSSLTLPLRQVRIEKLSTLKLAVPLSLLFNAPEVKPTRRKFLMASAVSVGVITANEAFGRPIVGSAIDLLNSPSNWDTSFVAVPPYLLDQARDFFSSPEFGESVENLVRQSGLRGQPKITVGYDNQSNRFYGLVAVHNTLFIITDNDEIFEMPTIDGYTCRLDTPTPQLGVYKVYLPLIFKNLVPTDGPYPSPTPPSTPTLTPTATVTITYTPTGTPTATFTPTPTEIPWQIVWYNEGTREVGEAAWTSIGEISGIVEELNYDPAGFGTTRALKETFTGPPTYRPGGYYRRAQPGKSYYWEGRIGAYINPPWKLGNTAYYNSSIAPALFNNGQDLRWLNAIGGFGPIQSDPGGEPKHMFSVDIWVPSDGRYPLALKIVSYPPGDDKFYWDPDKVITFGEKHRIETQLVNRTLSVFLDGSLLHEAPIDDDFTGELGGFHFGAYGGWPWPSESEPLPPGVDFPEGAFCYKANHFLAVRR
jgi:hypothetical protein